jgi:hypothetical protein
MATSKKRASALVRAEHGGAPVRLNAAERGVFDEALRLGADLADEMEAKVSSYGRWLLGNVFGNDAADALDTKTKNPVWLELIRRAGGPTLRVSRRMLYVALQVAARDKRITDQSWRGLDAGRKELLLPLETDKKLREAAQHVSKFNLTQAKTREYVAELIAEEGGSREVRLTAPVLVRRMKKLRESIAGHSVLRKVRSLRATATDAERGQIAQEIDELREALNAISKELRSR